MIDLIGVIYIVAAILSSGYPDEVHWHVSAGANISYSANGGSVEFVFGLDPTPVWKKPAPWPWTWVDGETCGVTDGYNVWIYPHPPCVDSLRHELYHVQQRRAFGYLGYNLLKLSGWDPEAHPQWTASDMSIPYGEAFPLVRIGIPIQWNSTR